MPRDVTVTFDDGTSHVYRGAPDDVTPDAVQARAAKEFGKTVKSLDGGRKAAPPTPAGQIPGAAPSMVAPPAASSEVPFGRRILGARPTGRDVIQFVRPSVEALGSAGGAVLGVPLGPLGVVGGEGLGYGLAKGGLDALETALGYRQGPRTAEEAVVGGATDVGMGSTMGAVGRTAIQAIGSAAGKIADLRQIPKQKAADIAKQALGRDLETVIGTLRNARPNASVAEITAGIENPTWQALIQRSLERDPQFVRKFNLLGERESRNALAQLAGGTTAAETRATVESAKNALNAMTGPQREAALSRANLGKAVAEYEAQAGKLGAEAAAEVQKVRDLISAGNAAEAWARLDLIKRGLPVGATKYTHFGELADKAFNEWSSQAANASLDLGQGARFAQGAADALRSVGIKPLEGEPLIRSLTAVGRNPEFAGNDLISGALKNVTDDIAKWTSSGGVIDARALDAIRKNSVNAAIQQLRPGMDATAQRNLAAGVLSEIKPALIDAIESAGGTGYRQYLADYTKGMQQISERKLVGEAARLWKTDKDAFVKLVQNESPEVVEKFLGKGNYNIATELADSALETLRAQAQQRIKQVSVKEQASEGQAALRELLRQNVSKFRLPSHLSAWVTNTNRSLQLLEDAIGKKTLDTLTQALKTPQGAEDLLSTLSGAERLRVSKLMQNPLGRGVTEAAKIAPSTIMPTVNALAPESQNQNALAP
jgi:hypothetical protein